MDRVLKKLDEFEKAEAGQQVVKEAKIRKKMVTDKEVRVSRKQCLISRKDFLKLAKPVVVQLNGQLFEAALKEFSTGSFGFYLNGKLLQMIGETPVYLQINLNLTVIGSKEQGK